MEQKFRLIFEDGGIVEGEVYTSRGVALTSNALRIAFKYDRKIAIFKNGEFFNYNINDLYAYEMI